MSTAILHHALPAPEPAAFGLCATCNGAGACAHQLRSTVQIHQCELFDNHTATTDPPVIRLVDEDPVEVAAEPVGVAGLCANCDHRSSCRLSRPAGGVWHCEEYR